MKQQRYSGPNMAGQETSAYGKYHTHAHAHAHVRTHTHKTVKINGKAN